MNNDVRAARTYWSVLRAIRRRFLGAGRSSEQVELDISFISASGAFNHEWYAERYPDVATSGMDAIRHYVLHGASEGRDPCVGFSTAFYLQANPDVASSKINPFRHYLEHGRQEGRRPAVFDSSKREKFESASEDKSSDVAIIAESDMFDREYYLRSNPDVAKAGIDPIKHYVRHGAEEGRNPSRDFDTWFYLAQNPDVTRSNVNAFRHYVERGYIEGRAGSADTSNIISQGPLVSLIIPIYAVERYLDECLKSVSNQTYRNLDVIVVDDGSPDRSYEIAFEHARKDPRFKIIRRENGGLGAARNTGVAEVRGRYLTFMDSDDILPRDAIAQMVGSLQKTKSDFVVGSIRRMKNGRVMPADGWVRQVHAEDRYGIRLVDFPEILTDVFACNKLFDVSFFRRNIGRFPERIRYEDQEPTAKAYMAGVFDVLVGTVYHWRIREDGTSITQDKANLDNLNDRLVVKEKVSKILYSAEKSVYETWLVKAIGFDLRSYFEQVPRTDQEFFLRLREGMLPLAKQLSTRLWQKVRLIDRLPALATLRGNRDDVCTAIIRRAEYGYFVPTCVRDGAVYLDRSYLEGMQLHLEDELLELSDLDLTVKAAITHLKWSGGVLRLEGHAYLTNVELGGGSWIAVRLVSKGRAPVDLNVRQRRCELIDRESGDAWSTHADCGFAVDIDPVALNLHSKEPWTIEVSVGSDILSESYKAVFVDVDVRSVRPVPAVCTGSDGSRWSAGGDAGIGLQLQQLSTSVALAHEVSTHNATVGIVVEGSATDTLLLVSQTLRRRLEVHGTRAAPKHVRFEFKLSDVSRRDNHEHRWQMYLCGRGVQRRLAWKGDLETLIRQSPEHHRIRVSMDQYGCLQLTQYSWFAVAQELQVDEDVITVCGHADVPGLSTLSAQLVGDSQRLDARLVKYDDATQTFQLSIPIDPAIRLKKSSQFDGSEEKLVEAFQPTTLHGFSLRLSAVFQDQSHERWLKVAERLELPVERIASRYGITFSRTSGSSALWVQFRPPYRDDERGRLAQQRLHASARHLQATDRSAEFELEDAVLFESFGGRQVSDSVLAICDEIQHRSLDLKLYWTVADLTLPVPQGTIPLLINSREWINRLHRVRYLVNNNNFPFYFRKSPGQTYLQTWHGTPLKKIGNHVPSMNLSLPYRQLMRRESKYWDFLLAQSDYAAIILPKAFDYRGKVLNVGYPRNDELVGWEGTLRRHRIRNQLGFHPYHFVVLYAPTWRDNQVGARGYSRVEHLDFKCARQVLGSSAKFMVRGHHNTSRNIPRTTGGVVDVTHHPNINDLLLAADLLITDYSSLMFDYVVTGKPIIFLAPDLEEYRDQVRGFYLDFEEVAPGPICRSNEELADALSQLGKVVDDYECLYSEFVRQFAPRDDGGAAVRVVDQVWGSAPGQAEPKSIDSLTAH